MRVSAWLRRGKLFCNVGVDTKNTACGLQIPSLPWHGGSLKDIVKKPILHGLTSCSSQEYTYKYSLTYDHLIRVQNYNGLPVLTLNDCCSRYQLLGSWTVITWLQEPCDLQFSYLATGTPLQLVARSYDHVIVICQLFCWFLAKKTKTKTNHPLGEAGFA